MVEYLFAPTTTQCMLRIVPAPFIRNFGNDWALLSLDASDAFLQCHCRQEHATLTKVGCIECCRGKETATWFRDFRQEIKAAVEAVRRPADESIEA